MAAIPKLLFSMLKNVGMDFSSGKPVFTELPKYLTAYADVAFFKSAQKAFESGRAIPLDKFRTWDSLAVAIPAAGANDDLGLVTGTFLTNTPILSTGDVKNAGCTRKAGILWQFPLVEKPTTMKLRLNAGMVTTVSSGAATIDVEVARVAAPTVDICATAAQSIKSLTAADKDFDITVTDLVKGDILNIVVTIAITDSATGTAVIGALNSIQPIFT